MPPERRHITLPSNTPAAVPPANARRPRRIISIVCTVKKCSALMVIPVPVARKIVTMLHNAFWEVSDRRSVTPDSRNRLPSISMLIRAATGGSSREMIIAEEIGNTNLSNLVTLRSCSILIDLSSLEVISFIIGG